MLQFASWPTAAFTAYALIHLLGLPEPAWPLLFLGSGIGLIMLVDIAFRGEYDREMLVATGLPLLSVAAISHVPLPKEDFAIMIVSSSMALTGFLYIRRAFRS